MRSLKILLIVGTLLISASAQCGNAASRQNPSDLDNATSIMMDPAAIQQRDQVIANDSKIYVIRGDDLKAVMIASERFQKYIKTRFKNHPSPLSKHMYDFKNYIIYIHRNIKNNTYTIHFSPLPFHDAYMKGGGTIYLIDSTTFKILEVEHTM